MAEDIVINGVTYPAVKGVAMMTADGRVVVFGSVQTVNGIAPDENGNVNVGVSEAEKEEIAQMVIELLGGVTARVSDNKIILSGDIPDGDYTAYYEVDGELVEIGDLTLGSVTPDPVTYTVTFVADGVTVAEETYTLENPVVEEPAVPAKENHTGVWETYDLSNGGDITVNAVYTAIETGPEPVTENITVTKDMSIVVGTGADRANTTSYCATQHIDVSNIPKPCVIKLTQTRWAYDDASESGHIRFYVADKSGAKLGSDYTHASKMPAGVTMECKTVTKYYDDVTVTVTSDTIGTLRFSGMYVYDGTGSASEPKATLTYTPAS